jgi:TPP-dependent pyruvate/acetoin dehydrogenase alpha subunit|tara:strand:+ start:578 stop:1540 length:963 start_codon:yes stop_codon:yes gene_type:complete
MLPEDLLDRYRMMARIRAFELAGRRLGQENRLDGTLHLSIGQEAVAAGVCGNLTLNDRITTTHRGHGHCLAKGADPRRMFAELFGRESGYCRGRSGSMHIADTATGNLGANAIVGAGVPIAVGAALAADVLNADWIALTFFGDGAVGEGALHESLNIAALWNLPVVFVCENNHYAELSPVADVLALRQISELAAPFGIPSQTVDGNDVEAVDAATADAVRRARSGTGPTFLEFDTYRQAGHFEGDQMRYRTKQEAAEWAERDPLELTERRLVDLGIDESITSRVREEAEVEMDAAVSWADAEKPATEASLFDDVREGAPA